ncbi:MAG: hypothetical protein ABL909_02850 [Sphingopyxis sp.]
MTVRAAMGRRVRPALLEAGAKASLFVAPLNSAAVRTYGQAMDARGKKGDARALMLLADRLSRRDGVAQSWLINDAVASRNAPEVLRRYDAVLRTYPDDSSALLTQLVSALASPQGRVALRPYMVATNPWRFSFLYAAVRTLPDSSLLADLLLYSPQLADTPDHREIATELVSKLASQGHMNMLRSIYPRLPGTSAASLASVKLDSTGITGYPPVTWSLAASNDFGGALIEGEGGDSTEIEGFAMPSSGGVVLKKLAWLNPGNTQLRWSITERAPNPQSWANWQIRCGARDDASIIAQSGNIFSAGTANNFTFAVPGQCPAVMIELKIAGGDGRDPSRIVLGNINLTR